MKQLNGKPLPEAVIVSALSGSTAKELRADIGKALNAAPDEKGTWFDMGGCFFTKEERVFIKEAMCVTIAILGIQHSVPEHLQRKAIFTAWAEEFYGTHSPEFYGNKTL
jgi:hypothetical protein